MRAPILGRLLDGLLQPRGRLVEEPLVIEGDAELLHDPRVLGREPVRLNELEGGVVDLADGSEGARVREPRVEDRIVELHRRFQRAHGLSAVLDRPIGRPEIEPRAGVVGLLLEVRLEVVDPAGGVAAKERRARARPERLGFVHGGELSPEVGWRDHPPSARIGLLGRRRSVNPSYIGGDVDSEVDVESSAVEPDVELDLSPTSRRSEWVLFIGEGTAFHAPICPALEARGFDVVIGTSLADAVATRRRRPSCIVCDADYHDGLGLELATALRAHAELLDVPLACISSDGDRRVAALELGADLALRAEGNADVAAAQIAALVRLVGRIEAGLEFRMPPPHGISGMTKVAPLTTVLTALGHERRSGVIELVTDDSTAHLEIIDGRAVSGAVGGDRVAPLATLRTMLGWSDGRFAFTALPLQGAPEGAAELWALCAEALCLQDEAAHAASRPALAAIA